MIRLIFILIQLIALFLLFLLLRQHTGQSTLIIGQWQMEIHTSLLLLFLLFLVLLAFWTSSLWFSVIRFWDRYKSEKSRRRWENTLDNLLIAESQRLQDLDDSQQISSSLNLSNNHPYVQVYRGNRLIKEGSLQKADEVFNKLKKKSSTRIHALHGLLEIARIENNSHELCSLSKEILESYPNSHFAHRIILEHVLQDPSLSNWYNDNILAKLSSKILHRHEDLLKLNTDWLLLQSRQREISGHIDHKDKQEAISLAQKAFTQSSDNFLAFERLIKSLVASEKKGNIKKAGKLIIKHWDRFASVNIGRIYRDSVLHNLPDNKKLSAIRALVRNDETSGDEKGNWVTATGYVVIAETLIQNEIWGEAHRILDRLQKDYPDSHKEIVYQLIDKIEDLSESSPKVTSL